MQSWDVRNPAEPCGGAPALIQLNIFARGGASSITPGGVCEPGAALEPLDKEAAEKLQRLRVGVGHLRMSSLNLFSCYKSPKPPSGVSELKRNESQGALPLS